MKRALQIAIITGVLALTGATPALSAGMGGGGGGGGEMPSGGAPQIDPQEAYRLGLAALQAQDYSTAVRHLRNLTRAAPNDPTANYLYAVALVGNNDGDDARRPLERATRGNDAPPDAWVMLGRLYVQQNDMAKANETLADLAVARDACTDACGAARRTQLEAAHAQLQQLIQQGATPAANPTTGWLPPGIGEGRAAFARAVGLVNQERYADALIELAAAREAIGPQADVLNYMGFSNRKLGHYDLALSYYGQALLLDPHHRGANEYLGELYIEMGRMDDARRQLAALDRLCPYGCAEREELQRWIVAAR